MNSASYLTYAICFAAGALGAGAHLFLLWQSASVLVRRRGYLPFLLGGAARFGLLVMLAVLAFWANLQGLEFLAAVSGFLFPRTVILKAVQPPVHNAIEEVG